jgi:hypothetical protein
MICDILMQNFLREGGISVQGACLSGSYVHHTYSLYVAKSRKADLHATQTRQLLRYVKILRVT